MSIWASVFAEGDDILDEIPNRENYSGATMPGTRGTVDVATARSWNDRIRLWVLEPGQRSSGTQAEAEIMLSHGEARELILRLTAALEPK